VFQDASCFVQDVSWKTKDASCMIQDVSWKTKDASFLDREPSDVVAGGRVPAEASPCYPAVARMAVERKRPWYLVLALLGALALGTTGALGGFHMANLYLEAPNPGAVGKEIADAHDRDEVVARAEEAVQALDAARARGWPLAVATLLLGSATLLFAMRALAGSPGARVALVQLVLAQAGVTIASQLLLRDVVNADLRVDGALEAAMEHASGVPPVPLPVSNAAVLKAASTLALVLRSLSSVLVVVGLTRARSRAYFDDSAAALEER
jgi:hypothetical protein